MIHHAYCLEGNLENPKKEVLSILNLKSDFELINIEIDSFGILESREVNNYQIKKTASKKIIIIKTKGITREAQNSLLKTFEEPSPNTHFFLILESTDILLPTLRSRLEIHKIHSKESDTSLGHKFLRAGKKERLEIVKEISEEKNKEEALKLLNQIEALIYEDKQKEKSFLKTLNKFRGYLKDRSPSIKMLLEHIALIAPREVLK